MMRRYIQIVMVRIVLHAETKTSEVAFKLTIINSFRQRRW